MIDLRFPNITGSTAEEQLGQVKTYLHQLVDQLNWALSTVESAQGGNAAAPVVYKQGAEATPQDAERTFNSIKALIIKSADIVMAYEDKIFTDFNGKYFADSDFGTYLVETNRKVQENSEGVQENYSRVESIDSRVEGVEDEVKITNAYIKRGLLSNGKYGLEIGETSKDGVFRQYARFTSEKLSFHDINDNEVAYIGAGTSCLYITGKAVFKNAIQFGKYQMDTSDGLAFTWIGG